MKPKTAVIIGAGPAGLTAAYELLKNTDIKPIILEATSDIGGVSKTVNYKGNRIDIGGHRFFSKSDIIMDWWYNQLPLQGAPSKDDLILNRDIPLSAQKYAPDPEKEDRVMLIRKRLSRIFFLRSFFDYPVKLNTNTLKNLRLSRISKIALSYLKVQLLPIQNEVSLEDFFINRFGRELYEMFFKDYTEKVWGVSCREIPQSWGAQRIKGLSIKEALIHALRNIRSKKDLTIKQKDTQTSLIEQFMYPKFGPGQLWEQVADTIKSNGGRLLLNHPVVGISSEHDHITAVQTRSMEGNLETFTADYFFSSMPMKDLINAFSSPVPYNVKRIADGLCYRDFITVGLLLTKIKLKNHTEHRTVNNIVPDNWIYIQEREVKLGRLQIFNNWSPYMVQDINNVWIGLEYFCYEGDDLWTMNDSDLAEFASKELESIDIIDRQNVIDQVVIRMPKAYPAYFGTYNYIDEVKRFTDQFHNLFLIGRNGMHRYNNMDHSMLSAMAAVENIRTGIKTKDNIWSINVEEDYHEEKQP